MKLSDICTPDLMQLDVSAADWQQAIALACRPLIEAGCVKSGYVEAIIDSVLKNGAYIVIKPGVALAHALAPSQINKTALGITILPDGVEFGKPGFDPVYYVFTLAALDGSSHMDAMASLATMLRNPDFFRILEQIRSADELYAYILKNE